MKHKVEEISGESTRNSKEKLEQNHKTHESSNYTTCAFVAGHSQLKKTKKRKHIFELQNTI